MVLNLRVLLFLVFEFLYPSRFLTFLADNLYLGVVLLIFYMFAKTVFSTTANRIFNLTTYIIVMIILLLAQLTYAIIDFNDSFYCQDSKVDSGSEVHNIIMHVFEIVIGVGSLISAFFVARIHSRAKDNKSEQEQELREMLNQNEDTKQEIRKLWIISIGCFICSIVRGMRAIISQFMIKNNKNYV